jgi:IS5 family transposase
MRAARVWPAKRPDAREDWSWNVGMRPGKQRAPGNTRKVDALADWLDRLKVSIRYKVEHPFSFVKRQFRHVKVRYRGLKKNTARLMTLVVLSNLLDGAPSLDDAVCWTSPPEIGQ